MYCCLNLGHALRAFFPKKARQQVRFAKIVTSFFSFFFLFSSGPWVGLDLFYFIYFIFYFFYYYYFFFFLVGWGMRLVVRG